MASAICCVRIVPDAPTIMPATISAMLSSAMPAAAAVRPVKALSVEMTTGMSAPPIGSTNVLPRIAALTSSSDEQHLVVRAGEHRDAATRPRSPSSATLRIAPPGIFIGLPLISSWSLANAMFEPQNEIEPMIALKTSGIAELERR